MLSKVMENIKGSTSNTQKWIKVYWMDVIANQIQQKKKISKLEEIATETMQNTHKLKKKENKLWGKNKQHQRALKQL